MEGRKDDLIQGLSRGLQQRVSLARVLVNDPDLLLLDEPASGLDPRARIELMEILRELKRMGKTIFISSHILSELAELCDSVTIIDRGHDPVQRPDGRTAPAQQRATDLPPAAGTRRRRACRIAQGYVAAFWTSRRPTRRGNGGSPATLRRSTRRRCCGRSSTWAGRSCSFGKDQRHLNEAFMDLTERGVRN